MTWDSARTLMNKAVTGHLGELLTFVTRDFTVTARGILKRPEQVEKLGLSHITVGAATLTMRRQEAPAWLARGVTVTTAGGESFEVTEIPDNGEDLFELILCRSS